MTMSPTPISRRQLAASLFTAVHIVEHRVTAAFIADAGTRPASNPFARTTAGAVRHVWRQRAVEFRSLAVEAVGLACLLKALSGLSLDEVLVQEILRAGPHTANIFHRGDGCWIVGAVLYGKPGVVLPTLTASKSRRPTLNWRSRACIADGQLNLFACPGA